MLQYIKVPPDTITLTNEAGEPVGTTNRFMHFLEAVNESTPQSSETESYLVTSIREKIEAFKQGAIANEDGTLNFGLEGAEISFLKKGLDFLRSQNRIAGSGWAGFATNLRVSDVKKPKLVTKGS